LERFEFQDYNTSNLPMDPYVQFLAQIEMLEVDLHLYRSLIGSLIYATNIKPNICYGMSAIK